jgi:DNA-binding MarR family transcriptional regulator
LLQCTHMELLARLLGGVERVKIMRFFLHHEDQLFSASDILDKTKSKAISAKKELTALVALGFIEKKRAKMVVTTGGKKAISKIKEVNGYRLNGEFPHNEALKELLFDFQLVDKKELASRFKAVGRIKLFVVAGIFINDPKSRLDILVVGESVKKPKAEKILEGISAEIGREVVYSIMDVEEYEYRIKMYDKFILDVIEMPNEKVIDKLSRGSR